MTRGYHNFLGIQKEESGQRFYFDGNVAAMEETGGKTAGGRERDASGREAFSNLHYYLQDELGSPLQVSGYGKGKGADISGYLTYGYDGISGTYFAQARECQTQNGRFTAEDMLKGKGTIPGTLNRYKYCCCNPLNMIDKNGMDGYYFYDPEMFKGVDSEGNEITTDVEKIKDMDIAYLEEKYNTTVHPIAMDPDTCK